MWSSGLPWWLSGREYACQYRRPGSIPGWGRSPRGGHDYPLQYSCLGNPMDRVAWWATVHRIAKSHTTEATEHARMTPYHICWIFFRVSIILFYKGTCVHVQSCLTVTLWTVGLPVHGIFPERILEWVAISSSRRSSQPRMEPKIPVSLHCGWILHH